MIGFLNSGIKSECSGCEACAQSCPVNAIRMCSDEEGFRYPEIDNEKCIYCGKCHRACPVENPPIRSSDAKLVYGGHCIDYEVLQDSTSGGAFSAIVYGWCDENYVIFGAISEGLRVFHGSIDSKTELSVLRKSKYLQSEIGKTYQEVNDCLKAGKKVLFSGTPCQVAGLRSFLNNTNQEQLLTVEVVCEGVPTPHFVQGMEEYLAKKGYDAITSLDYRYKNIKRHRASVSGKWDFQVMKLTFSSGISCAVDRWFNPFWSIWLQHLMSRPSCYQCPYASAARTADITLGDLWGVHLYCPELYNKNAGASLVICNTEKGRKALNLAMPYLEGHELSFETALKYQGPIRGHIKDNPRRNEFMNDVCQMEFNALCHKWAVKPSLKLLWQKYVWGNRQKVWLWNVKRRRKNINA